MEAINIKTFETIMRRKLHSIGYFDIKIHDEKKNSFEVVALGKLRDIFLKVVIKRLIPDEAVELTSHEISIIKRSAVKNAKEPWAAIMYVNDQGQLVDGIKWQDLSKADA